MALKCCSLASGSSGNSFYIASDNTKVLVDAGISCSRIKKSLKLIGVDPLELHGIIVTHEHTDHISGISVCARTMKCPLYLNRSTWQNIQSKLNGTEEVRLIESNRPFNIGDLCFKPFSVLHDAVDPMGLVVSDGIKKLGIATDLGKVTSLVREELRQSHLLIMESNHDEKMLFANPRYPWSLKQRIKGSHGHLSNEAAGDLLADIVHSGLKTIMLAHISRENNHPELVLKCVLQRLTKPSHLRVVLLKQEEMSELFEV
jgi:phosphoribosyl 1,2-cyclic phosphodiesterase